MLATGCSTGIVVDIGFSETRCVAIGHGRPILTTVQIRGTGMKDVNDLFRHIVGMLEKKETEVEEYKNEDFYRSSFKTGAYLNSFIVTLIILKQ